MVWEPVQPRTQRNWWAPLVFGFSAGCLGLVPPTGDPQSLGHSSDGVLRNGVPLPRSGSGFVSARPGDQTRYGTPTLIGALSRAVKEVQRAYPGGAPLRVGDLSAPRGGQHPRHRSHRVGRDADAIFYAVDAQGHSLQGSGFHAYDRFGISQTRSRTREGGELRLFDDARNWYLVRSLLLDPQAHVQWILCSSGIKARLLRYAASHERDPRALFRASWVLHQPSRGRSHDDHFHIRVACTAQEIQTGCVDQGPVWPWLRNAVEKPEGGTRVALTDPVLVRTLMHD